jgi:peptide/nickel transport system ATP-binding protein/oligopeptide transport system ATP-binding protein
MNGRPLLSVENLSTHFATGEGVVRAVQNVSFAVGEKKTFAIVGESGCGKTVTALSIMRLVSAGQGRVVSGRVVLDGTDLLLLDEKRMRRVRGNRIAMIFQEPMTSLNPVYTVGNQIGEAIALHQGISGSENRRIAAAMIEKVGIAEAAQCLRSYPHQLSGGMCQRVMIAMAVSCRPSLLIADEPTTALDVTIQAQILDLLDELQAREAMSILLITHDLGIVAQRANDVAVMYASRIVERSGCRELFRDPLHPYTRGLLESLPRSGRTGGRLAAIPGSVPNPLDFPAGCKFHPRCGPGRGDRRCRGSEPELREVEKGRYVACWKARGFDDSGVYG